MLCWHSGHTGAPLAVSLLFWLNKTMMSSHCFSWLIIITVCICSGEVSPSQDFLKTVVVLSCLPLCVCFVTDLSYSTLLVLAQSLFFFNEACCLIPTKYFFSELSLFSLCFGPSLRSLNSVFQRFRYLFPMDNIVLCSSISLKDWFWSWVMAHLLMTEACLIEEFPQASILG